MKDTTKESVAGYGMTGNKGVLPTRRKYTLEQKRRIVEEAFAPGASVSIVARRHDVNSNLVFTWRRKYREGTLVDGKVLAGTALPAPGLVRIGVVEHSSGIRPPSVIAGHPVPAPVVVGGKTALPEPRPSGLIEIELICG